MERKGLFHGKNFFLFNLVLVGIIIGFTLSLVAFSCSTKLPTGDDAFAQEAAPVPPVSETDIANVQQLQRVLTSISAQALPVVVQVNVTEVTNQQAPQGDLPWFYYFFENPPDGGDDDDGREFRNQGLGSGVIVRRDGETYYVLTNNHVVGDADEIQITLFDGREIDAELIGKDPRKDLALISFRSDADLPVAVLGDSDGLQVGQIVLAVGSPFGFTSTVTMGIVSALGRRGGPAGNISDFIQTDASINQGNSGGALMNTEGEVIGINTWIAAPGGGNIGLGFAIPINNAKKDINDLIQKGSVQYGWLGVSIADITRVVSRDMNLDQPRGGIVYNTFIGSPADEDGILPGDVIVSLNGRRIDDSTQLTLQIGDLTVGERAEFGIFRRGERIDLTVTIGQRADEQSILEARNLWPGMSVHPLTDEIRSRTNLARNLSGVIVTDIAGRSPADVAGIRTGDVIAEINGSGITSMADFYRQLNQAGADEVRIGFVREGVRLSVGVSKP